MRASLALPEGAARRKRRRALLCRGAYLAAAAILLAALLLVNAFVFPLRYLWVLAAYPASPEWEEGELCVWFLDVGQGDATFVRFPGGETMLIDGGDGSYAARQSLLSALFAAGVDELDYLLLTHDDLDHAGGLAEAAELFGAQTLWLPSDLHSDAALALSKYAKSSEAQVRTPRIFESVVSGTREQPCVLLFLSPLAEAEGNAASPFLYLEYAGRRILLAGEGGTAAEDALVGAWEETEGAVFECTLRAPFGTLDVSPDLSDIDVLRAGHHGSAYSTGEALCALTSPAACVFSSGAGNSYGHPSPETADRLLKYSPDVGFFRTDELGNILLRVTREGACTLSAERSVAQID